MRQILFEVYKLVNNYTVPAYLHNLVTYKDVPYNMRNVIILDQPKYKTVKYGQQNIKYQGAKLWNRLPNNIKEAVTLNDFKELILKWNGPECKCSTCNLCILNNM